MGPKDRHSTTNGCRSFHRDDRRPSQQSSIVIGLDSRKLLTRNIHQGPVERMGVLRREPLKAVGGLAGPLPHDPCPGALPSRAKKLFSLQLVAASEGPHSTYPSGWPAVISCLH
jgi:hypothetical protein